MNRRNITIKDTLDGSTKQHIFYKDKWRPLEKQSGVFKALWLVGELGEVIDIIKKRGPDMISTNKKVRAGFVKEVVDCYMYIADILNCYGITAKEIGKAYFDKLDFNLKNPRKYWRKKPEK